MLQFAQDLKIDQPLAAIWEELNETDLYEDDNLQVAGLIPLLLHLETAEGNEYYHETALSIAKKYYENAFSVNASAAANADLLIGLIALYYASGDTAIPDKINPLIGRIINDLRIGKTGMFWIDGRIRNEISFVHLQYKYCLAFYELGRCFDNESLVHVIKPVLKLTDAIADLCFQNLFESVITSTVPASSESVLIPVEAMMMRMTIFKLAGEAGNSFIDNLQNQLTGMLALLPEHMEGRRSKLVERRIPFLRSLYFLSGKYLSFPGRESYNRGNNNKRLLSGYPFIGLQSTAANKRSVLQYFYFTFFTLKEIVEEKTGSFTCPDFGFFCEKDRFVTFLEAFKQYMSAEELKTVEALHEYELHKLNLEQCFLCFDEEPACQPPAGVDADKWLQLHPQGKIFNVFRNHNISVMKTILETVITDENFYTVFVYPDMHDRRVKEEVLTRVDEEILVAFSKPVSTLSITSKLAREMGERLVDSSLTNQGIRRKISLFEKKGMLVHTQL